MGRVWYIPRDLDTDEPTANEPTANEPSANESTARGRGRSPSLAALLSFLWPGLGQLYTGKRRPAVFFAVPALLVTLFLVYQLRRGPVVFAAQFVDWRVGLTAAVIVILVGAWRLAAVAQAFLSGEQRHSRRILDRAVLAALVAVIVFSHAGAGYVLIVTSDAGRKAFSPGGSLVDLTPPSPGPGQNGGGTSASTPSIDKRVTILFTGVDSAAGRDETLYDSLMVVSYDPKTNSVQMVSVPRDSASFQMYYPPYPVTTVTTRINSIPTYVHNGWIKSPDSPYITLVNEVQYLVGIHIDYYAVMDFAGFVAMIDKVGGIDVVNATTINDTLYDWLDGVHYGFYLAAGPQHLDGKNALAYVRSRRSDGDNDWKRAARQQEVVVDLLHKMAQPDQLLNLPSVISTLGASVTTNFPADQVADYVAIGQNVTSQNISQVVLGPPYSLLNVNHVDTASTTCLLIYKVAAESITLFGKDSLWYGKPAPDNTCPPSY